MQSQYPPSSQIYYLLPAEFVEAILSMSKKLDSIQIQLEQQNAPDPLKGHISEAAAKVKYNRGTTWFHTKRKEGLPFIKIGATTYYCIAELAKFFGNDTS